MKKFVVEDAFWQLFPDCHIGVVTVFGMNPAPPAERLADIGALLEQSNREAPKYLTEATFSDNPVVAVWREAYRKFKTKKGVRSSIEALLKRVDKGGVGPIIPLVDLYNSVSLRYALPCGGEDIGAIEGDLRLTVTAGGDDFLALGDEQSDPTLPGEVCYLDSAGAVCRCWNWRDGQRTMLTESTTDAILLIESVDPARAEDLEAALQALAEGISEYFGGTVQQQHIDRQHPEIPLERA